MNKGTRWIIIDTETDGLYEPIHVVELCGQLMEGWQPVGDPFRMLLNHDVPIPPEAVAIHGYTQEYLRQHGQEPVCVYTAFRDYAHDYPLVAHNLSCDWNRCLEPEWARLGVARIGQRGFCSMMLARRLVTETTTYRLEALKECFHLTQSQSHQAQNDVLTVVELFQQVYRPRLESAGLDTIDSVTAFTKRTPVAKCLAIIHGGSKPTASPPQPKDEWYFLDAANNARGPLPAREASKTADLEAYYVWREGMPDWVVNRDCPEFAALSQSAPPAGSPPRKFEATKTMGELIGVCRGLIADNKITTAEVMFLNAWLQDFGFIAEWPASEIAQTVERILEDGVVTKAEEEELKRLIQGITAASGSLTTQFTRHDPPESSLILPAPQIPEHYAVVELEQGSREWLEWRHKGIGASDAPAIMSENPWKSATELLREKCGPARDLGLNAAMARGTQLEPEARRRYMVISPPRAGAAGMEQPYAAHHPVDG